MGNDYHVACDPNGHYYQWWKFRFLKDQLKFWGRKQYRPDKHGLPQNTDLRYLIQKKLEYELNYGKDHEEIFNAGYNLGKEQSHENT